MVVHKSHPALLIIDMQNGFCQSKGSFSRLGLPVSSHLAIVPAINSLRSAFHAKGLPVFFTRMGFNNDYSDSGILLESLPALKDIDAFVRGTWDAEILDELTPNKSMSEVVVDKTRNTAF